MMKKWGIAIGAVVLIALVIKGVVLYHGVESRQQQIKKHAITEAKRKYDVKQVIKATTYRGTHAYVVVLGIDKNGKKTYVWLPRDKGKAYVKPASEGWSRQKVVNYVASKLDPKKIIDIRPGIEENIPVWEIVFIDHNGRYTFYYLRFDGQDWVKNIHL
ncbi:MAG TPA: DUF5590 domain-containing protein [Bacillales bacterium]|nr:DUF5590 domain-containing protein [Bacillales bacterium]